MATLYILYGSVTGNAEGIALDLAEKQPPSFFSKIVCKPMEEFKKFSKVWSEPPKVGTKHGLILIASTTGNGDVPENASKFVRYIKKKQTIASKPFQHCAVSVLGLGDTNYDIFCATGKAIDKKMIECGAIHAQALACADEATGLEEVVEPWVDSVFINLEKACSAPAASAPAPASAVSATSSPPTVSETEEDAAGKEKATESKEKEEEKQEDEKTATAPPQSTGTVETEPPPEKSEYPLFILYGSATGNAEHIAKDLADTYEIFLKNPDAKTFFPSVVCCEMDQFKKKCLPTWEKEPPKGTKHGVIVITSTTGDGDPPENAGRFMRYIKRTKNVDEQPFKHVNFAVLALGDTNYDQFCNTGKIVNKKLLELGGTRSKPLGCADEATGLEEVVEPWTSTVLTEMTVACRGKGAPVTSTSTTSISQPKSDESKRDSNNVDKEEEKKMENFEVTTGSSVTATTATTDTKTEEEQKNDIDVGFGVRAVRGILGLGPDSPFPEVDPKSLPSVPANRSTCKFVTAEINDTASSTTPDKNNSIVDDDGDDDMLIDTYTHSSPYESKILNARYLTNTPTLATNLLPTATTSTDTTMTDESICALRNELNSKFPLEPNKANNSNGHDDNEDDDKEKFNRNGKRVLEVTLELPSSRQKMTTTSASSEAEAADGTKKTTTTQQKNKLFDYQPGDAIGLLIGNKAEDVIFVLNMLQKHHTNVKRTQLVSIDDGSPMTVETVIRECIDLSRPIRHKRILMALANKYCSNDDEKLVLTFLSSKKDEVSKRIFDTYIVEQRRSIVDILKEFPSCQKNITLEGLISLLPSIPPRYYSICSSPLQSSTSVTTTTKESDQAAVDDDVDDGTTNNSLTVAFSVVDYLTPSLTIKDNAVMKSKTDNDDGTGDNGMMEIGRRRISGMATCHLEAICYPMLLQQQQQESSSFVVSPPTVKIFPKPAPGADSGDGDDENNGIHAFRLPKDLSTPLMLIGPGTGIAPFMGFLMHRKQLLLQEKTKQQQNGFYLPENTNIGQVDVYFGCRHSKHDYLYENEMKQLHKEGIITNLFAAFSRDGNTNTDSTTNDDHEQQKYVQHIMKSNPMCQERIVQIFTNVSSTKEEDKESNGETKNTNKKGMIYICGDGNHMAHDVQDAIGQVIDKYHNSSSSSSSSTTDNMVDGKEIVKQLKSQGRLLLDIWS